MGIVKEDDSYYQKAIQYFKQVESINENTLPPQFVDFVKEWEQDME